MLYFTGRGARAAVESGAIARTQLDGLLTRAARDFVHYGQAETRGRRKYFVLSKTR